LTMGTRKNMKEKKKPDVNPALNGLDITINSFGEIQSTYDIDKINDFLDHHVNDKKLKNKEQSDDDENREKQD